MCILFADIPDAVPPRLWKQVRTDNPWVRVMARSWSYRKPTIEVSLLLDCSPSTEIYAIRELSVLADHQ